MIIDTAKLYDRSITTAIWPPEASAAKLGHTVMEALMPKSSMAWLDSSVIAVCFIFILPRFFFKETGDLHAAPSREVNSAPLLSVSAADPANLSARSITVPLNLPQADRSIDP